MMDLQARPDPFIYEYDMNLKRKESGLGVLVTVFITLTRLALAGRSQQHLMGKLIHKSQSRDDVRFLSLFELSPAR